VNIDAAREDELHRVPLFPVTMVATRTSTASGG
jgi:hypothetical protein